jgi:hypothetical protein
MSKMGLRPNSSLGPTQKKLPSNFDPLVSNIRLGQAILFKYLVIEFGHNLATRRTIKLAFSHMHSLLP